MDKWISEISQIVLRTGATLKGPIPLPTHKQKFTVNRSPHIDKKSREQFEMRTHKRLLIINEPTAQTLNSLMALDMPADLDIDLKLPSTETVLSAA